MLSSQEMKNRFLHIKNHLDSFYLLSKIEYDSIKYASASSQLLKILESIRNFEARIVTEAFRTSSTNSILSEISLILLID